MRAVDYGIALAKKEENVELVALHVLFFRQKSAISFMADLAGSQATFQIPEKLNLEIQEWFGKAKEKADQNQVQLRTDTLVSAKPVMRAIVDYADSNHFDLIIVGTRGSSKARRLLIGSVASEVVTHSHCPVMVIK